MTDFFSSLWQHFKAKAKTQVFGIFGFWWVVFHSNYFLVLLIIDEQKIYEKTGLLKNEYLQVISGDYTEWQYWVKFITPFILTYFTIWMLPKMVLDKAYRKEKDNELIRQKIRLEYEKKKESLEATFAEKNAEALEMKSQALSREKDIEKDNPELLWEQEYENLPAFVDNGFNQLIKSLYTYGGRVEVTRGAATVFSLNSRILAYVDSSGLVDYDRARGLISLTQKGKYFLKRYQEQNE
jgi:hypothetical protein